MVDNEGYIDIHNHVKQYSKFKNRLEKEGCIVSENTKVILEYLRQSELGKTIKKGQKKIVGTARNYRVAGILMLMSDEWFKKPFNEVTVHDMEKFIGKLQSGEIKSNRGKIYK